MSELPDTHCGYCGYELPTDPHRSVTLGNGKRYHNRCADHAFDDMMNEQGRAAVQAAQPGAVGEPVALPMDTAPKDASIIRLLVEFEDGSLEDDNSAPIWTIGTNHMVNTGIDEWLFAGWNWTHDCFTQGTGKPVGWLPMLAAAPTEAKPATQQASGEREALTEPGRDLIAGVLRCAAWTHDAVGAPALAKQAREALETFKRAALSMPARDAVDAALAYLDDLKDDAAAHIWPDDLKRCQTSECVVGVCSVRMGSPDGTTVPLFSREQVADAIRAAISAKKGGAV